MSKITTDITKLLAPTTPAAPRPVGAKPTVGNAEPRGDFAEELASAATPKAPKASKPPASGGKAESKGETREANEANAADKQETKGTQDAAPVAETSEKPSGESDEAAQVVQEQPTEEAGAEVDETIAEAAAAGAGVVIVAQDEPAVVADDSVVATEAEIEAAKALEPSDKKPEQPEAEAASDSESKRQSTQPPPGGLVTTEVATSEGAAPQASSTVTVTAAQAVENSPAEEFTEATDAPVEFHSVAVATAESAGNDQEEQEAEQAAPEARVEATANAAGARQQSNGESEGESSGGEPLESKVQPASVKSLKKETSATEESRESGGEEKLLSEQSNQLKVDPSAPFESPEAAPDQDKPVASPEARDAEPSTPGPRQEPSQPTSIERIAAGRAAPARAEQAGADQGGPRVDPARFIGRVSRAFETAQNRGGEVRLRLSPPELGSLQIKLTMSEGAMTATIETETTAARNLLLDNLPALRDRLAEQQIRVEKFDVDVRQDGGRQEHTAPDDRRQDTQDHNPRPAPKASSTIESTIDAAPARGPVDPTNPGAINLVA